MATAKSDKVRVEVIESLVPAVFSNDRLYRYILRRRLEGYNPRRCLFICLNPSTADEVQDDPTVRRCRGFATAWGFGVLEVANIFALRSTDPKLLYTSTADLNIEPVGEDNDQHIYLAARDANLVVLAWGNHGKHLDRGQRVMESISNLRTQGVQIAHLGLTNEDQPKHPLYLAKDTELQLWERQS